MKYFFIWVFIPCLVFGQGFLFEKNENGTFLNGSIVTDQYENYALGTEVGRTFKGMADLSLGFSNTNPGGITTVGLFAGFHPVKQDTTIPLSLAFHFGVARILTEQNKETFGAGQISVYTKILRSKTVSIMAIAGISSIYASRNNVNSAHAEIGFVLKNGNKGKLYLGPYITRPFENDNMFFGISVSFITLYQK